MPYVLWSDDMVCGIASVDAQHQKLVALLNQVYDSVSSGEAHQNLHEIFNALIEYTIVHFSHEESVFAANGYPALQAHKAQHEKLKQEVIEHQNQLGRSQDMMMAAEMLYFLKEWLTHHIQEDDKKGCRYILEHGGQPA